MISQNFRHSSKKPRGMSSASPPTWKYRVCMRVPATISKRSSTRSRSRNVYQKGEIAPSSSAEVPSQTRCEWTRLSSTSSMRIQVAFGGTSMPSSFSTAITNASSLAWKAR